MDQSFLTAADLSVLHDAELSLIAIDRAAARLKLGFDGVDGRMHVISFHGILTHRINNLQYQNVVSRVLISGADLLSDSEMERIARWTCSGAEEALLISEQFLQQHLARVRAGELRLFYVDPSWGAEVGVIAERFYLSDDEA